MEGGKMMSGIPDQVRCDQRKRDGERQPKSQPAPQCARRRINKTRSNGGEQKINHGVFREQSKPERETEHDRPRITSGINHFEVSQQRDSPEKKERDVR